MGVRWKPRSCWPSGRISFVASQIADFPPASVAMSQENNWLSAGRPVGFGWLAQDISASGAMGDATKANVEKGEACADYGATAFIELLHDVESFDLAELGSGPLGHLTP